MIGVEERETASGIHVVRLHYTADPAKRSEEWLAQARQGYASERDWRREMEIDWHIASGLPVYAEQFTREWHVAKEPLLADGRREIPRGWDFGLQPACVWCQIDAMGRMNVLSELVTWNGRGDVKEKAIDRFTPDVVELSNRDYYGAEFRDWADPAGWSRAQTDERTCIEIMATHQIYANPGPVTWTQRKRAMGERLSMAIAGRPAILIDPGCTMLIEGFEGAYRYEQIGETGRYKEQVEKNAWSHIMNALEYVVGAVYAKRPNDDGERRQPRRQRPGGNPVTGY